jgi:hypothetical protein
MALDLDNSYKQAQDKLRALKTFSEVKSSVNKAIAQTETNTTPNFDLSSFNLDQAEIQRQIKKKMESQFDQLLSLVQSNRGSGPATGQFLIKKFVQTIKILNKKLPDILAREIIKALGCDFEQTFTGGQEIWVKMKSIDLSKLLFVSPDSKVGRLKYERTPYTTTNVPSSINRMLYERIQNEGELLSSAYGSQFLGYSTNPLFDIEYQQVNAGDITGWFRVVLSDRPGLAPGSQIKVSEFLTDYYKTIKVLDFKALTAALLDLTLGAVSIKLRMAQGTIDDSTRFGLLVQRILGMCFDEGDEISIAGQAKTPELDDTTDTFFEMTDVDFGIIEQRTAQILKGVVSFQTCDNVELPVDAEVILDLIEENLNKFEEGEGLEETLNAISTYLSNDPNWSLSFPFPDQLKITLDFSFIKQFPQAVVSCGLGPKVILPFMIMIKALGIPYDEDTTGMANFIRKNRALMNQLISQIGAEFVRILFEEIKKDIRNLIRSIITDISKDETGTTAAMIDKLISIALIVVTIVKDYRRCKSVIDSILALLNFIPLKKPSIPIPLLQFSALLPGYSPNKAFINSIEKMQQLGLPTGPLPDGSPNLGLQAMYSQLKGADTEQKENGKLELSVVTPFGVFKGNGKSV